MADKYTRRITLYINGKEIKNELASIKSEMNKMISEQARMTIGSDEYIKKGKEIKVLKGMIQEHNDSLKTTGSMWDKLGKMGDNFNRYFGMFATFAAGFGGLIYSGKQAISAFAEFDDKVGDVMKTTGMAKDRVYAMNEELKKMNTRTAQNELLGLGKIAGKLGLTAEEDVKGFIRAADKINVALKEDLGGDAEESINQVGKLVDIFKVKETFGIEESMLKVGSAINSLGAASTANEGYIVEFTKRVAGVAPAAGVNIQQVMGLAATLDQLGQTSEVSSTVYSAVITGMFQDTADYAKIAGMSVKDFSGLLKKDANEAFIKLLEGLHGNTGGMTELTDKMDGLGLEGKRSISVLGVLANNTDILREQQKLSNIEFEKGTSLTNEFNVKNETAQAKLDKASKSLSNMTVELGQKLMPILTISTSGMGYFVKAMSAIIDFALKHSGAIITLTSSIAAYTVIAKIEAYWLEKTFQARMANMAAAKASKIAKEAETKATELGIVATLNQQMADNAATEAKELRIAASKAKKAADIAETTTTELQTAATEAQILADEASATSKELNNKAITSKKLAEAAATKATGLNTAAIEAQALADKSATKTTILGTIATKASELAKKTGTAATLLFAAAKAILNRDIGRASAAMRLFNTTVGMSPLGVLAAALAVVIGTFVVLASKMTEAQRVMKTLIDVETEATKNTLEQKVSLEQLWQIANDHKRSLEDRKHAIEEINKISPKFLGDITLETIGTEKATKAKEAYIESLLKEARVKAAKDKLVEIGKKILDIQSGNEDQVSWYEKTFNMFISTGNYASTMARNAESDIRNSNKEIKKLTAEQTALAKIATDNQVMNLTIEEEITKKLREMHKETNNQKKIDLVKEIEILKKRAKAIADAKEKEDATYNPNKDLSKGEKEAAKKRIELEKTYQDMLIAIMDDGRLKEIANENKKHEENLVNFKEHKKLTELEEIRHQKELRSIEEKYSVEKLESKKSPLFNEPKLAAFQENPEMRQKILEAEYERKLYEETAAGKKEILADLLATNEISEKEYNDRIRQMDRELLAEKLEMYNEKFGQLFSSIDQIITNSEQRELNKYKKAQDAKKKELDKRLKNGLMSQEAYDAEIKKIDEETDRRQAELAYNQAVRQKVVAAFDIITNTAAGVIKTLGQTGFFGIPLAAIVGAMGAAQLGVVLSTPLPELPGKEQGGFLDVNRSQDNKKFRAKNQPDKRGYVSSPTIITGENGLEYIVPDEATSNPTIRPVLDILEMARQNKNLSTLNFPEVYEATVSNRMSGRESGGSLNGRFDSARFDSAQRPGTSSASTSFASTSLSDRSLQTAEMISVLVKLDATVSDLKKKLDDPIQTYVTVHGKNGLSEKLKEYDNLKNNASL